MKSVSFSDLRHYSDMTNRIDQISNSGDSNIKRSSSYKNLTYYSSSEDILKRFSSKTNELKTSKDLYKSDDSHNEQIGIQHDKSSTEKQKEASFTEKLRDKYQDTKITSSDSTIQDLKSIISDQEKTISNLQEKNLILQNESHKNSEEIKFQENRIKYLEHMLAAFNTNLQDNNKKSLQPIEDHQFTGTDNTNKATQFNVNKNKVNFEKDVDLENVKYSSTNYTRDFGNQYNDTVTDLKKRPNSADSSLNPAYMYTDNSLDKDKPHQYLHSSVCSYASDSEDKVNSRNYDGSQNQKLTQNDYVTRHRQKLDRDRSLNLSDFKNRLDEFTKYAKRSTEQNSLTQHSFSKPPKKYSGVTDTHVDQQYKSRPKATSQATDTRPPIDPYYKQRRNLPVDVKTNYDRSVPQSTKMLDSSVDEDEHLKERVQKILEKHNYPATAYRTENNWKMSEYQFKGSNDGHNSVPSNVFNYRVDERNFTDSRYGWNTKDSSNIPRLDLSLYNNTSTGDLISKYLNYQGSTNVS